MTKRTADAADKAGRRAGYKFIRRSLSGLRPYRTAAFSASVLAAASLLFSSVYIQRAIDGVLQTAAFDARLIVLIALSLSGVTLMSGVTLYLSEILEIRSAQKTRASFYSAIINDYTLSERFAADDLLARAYGVAASLGAHLTSVTLRTLSYALMLAGYFAVLCYYSYIAALSVAAAYAVYFSLNFLLNKKIAAFREKTLALDASVRRIIRQGVYGNTALKVLGETEYYAAKADKAFADLKRLEKRSALYAALTDTVSAFIDYAAPLLVAALSAYLSYVGQISIGVIMLSYVLTDRLNEPVRNLRGQLHASQLAVKLYERIEPLIL